MSDGRKTGFENRRQFHKKAQADQNKAERERTDMEPISIIRTPVPVTESKPGKANPLAAVEALLAEILAELKRKTKSQGRNSSSSESQWLKTANAAARCDYSEATFQDYAREYEFPRHGPKLNRYDREEIDQWMKDPSCFLNNPKSAVKSGASYKPKKVDHLMNFILSGIRR